MKLNNRGISLVQVIVTAALLSVAALTGIKMMRLQMKVAKTTALRFEISYILEEMVALLADPVSCSSNLKGFKPRGEKTSIHAIAQETVDPNSKDIIRLKWFETFEKSEKHYGQDLVKIISYGIDDTDKDVSLDRGTTNLLVTFDRGEQALGGQFIQKKIKLNVKLHNGRIASCRASRNPPRRVQADFTWKYDFSESHIYYDNGSVGVGGEPGEEPLTVNGPVQLLPSEPTECVANIEGSLRYDEREKGLFFCNGRGKWVALGMPQIDWSNPSQYVLVSNGAKKGSLTTGAHKKCFLSSVHKRGQVRCFVNPTERGTWQLNSELLTGNEEYRCVASCFN